MLRTALLVFPFVFAGCANNYEFARARKPDGSFDTAKLITDLKASGKEELSEGTWIPLLHLDLTTFRASKPGFPPGYTLSHLVASAPIFCVGSQSDTVVDAEGRSIEADESSWVGWGVLWHDHEERVETTAGTRRNDGWSVALVFGNQGVHYTTPPAPAAK